MSREEGRVSHIGESQVFFFSAFQMDKCVCVSFANSFTQCWPNKMFMEYESLLPLCVMCECVHA